jgi:hypothetical protein
MLLINTLKMALKFDCKPLYSTMCNIGSGQLENGCLDQYESKVIVNVCQPSQPDESAACCIVYTSTTNLQLHDH